MPTSKLQLSLVRFTVAVVMSYFHFCGFCPSGLLRTCHLSQGLVTPPGLTMPPPSSSLHGSVHNKQEDALQGGHGVECSLSCLNQLAGGWGASPPVAANYAYLVRASARVGEATDAHTVSSLPVHVSLPRSPSGRLGRPRPGTEKSSLAHEDRKGDVSVHVAPEDRLTHRCV